MTKNIKKIFFVLTLITLLIAVGAVSAADDANTTAAVDDSVSGAAVSDNDYVATEPVQTTSNDKVDAKTIEKEEKNLKTATKTVEVNNMDELTNTLNSAVDDADNDEYIINLNEGTYNINDYITMKKGSYSPNIIINANNQIFTATGRNRISLRKNITINDATIKSSILIYDNLTLNNVSIQIPYPDAITARQNSTLSLNNVTLNSVLVNKGEIFIGDDIIFESTAEIRCSNGGKTYCNNTNLIYPYVNTFSGNSTLTNITIDKAITNDGQLTLKNVTIDNKITNNNQLIISDGCILTDNFVLEGEGEVIIEDMSILPTYTGNVTISNKTLANDKKNYGNLTLNGCNVEKAMINYGNITMNNCNLTGYIVNGGNITLNNCTINSENSSNIGFLYLNNCTANNYWLTNYLVVIVDEESNINETIINEGNTYKGSLPEDNYYPTKYIINNITAQIFFKDNTLSDFINPDSTLDFQGTISGIPEVTSLVINKPVNIITSTNDGRIENFGSITYNNGASGSNITGLYTYNTQFYVRNAHNMVFNNISNVVVSKGVGWGVGQTSIRENSTNITVKNSYFYTKDNGGSSTFVFGWADNCILINSTVEADGNVGNLIYLTTYNVDVPSGVVPNSNNQIINNTIRGPETPMAICWAIVLSGMNNTIDGNTINYTGTGITGQWGSGVTGVGVEDNETSLVGIYNNKIYNNIIDCGNAFTGIRNTTLINNTIYNGLFAIGEENIVYNNTASNVRINGPNAVIKNNNFTGTLNITGSNNEITNNNLITDNTYTMTGNGINNIITDNYLKSNSLYGDDSVNLDSETNMITNNTPRYELLLDSTTFTAGENTTITASIYFDGEIVNTVNKGKVTFKVNGKTLKDANGKVIYAKVTNGVATIEGYEVPAIWTKEGTTIEAIYSGSTQCAKLETGKVNMTVSKTVPTLTTESITASAGETITLTATITDGDNAINTGKVVFKINGKTVKDTNGKVIYAKVTNNQVNFTYTLPSDMKAKEYNLTATFISSDYDKLEDVKTLTVTV